MRLQTPELEATKHLKDRVEHPEGYQNSLDNDPEPIFLDESDDEKNQQKQQAEDGMRADDHNNHSGSLKDLKMTPNNQKSIFSLLAGNPSENASQLPKNKILPYREPLGGTNWPESPTKPTKNSKKTTFTQKLKKLFFLHLNPIFSIAGHRDIELGDINALPPPMSIKNLSETFEKRRFVDPEDVFDYDLMRPILLVIRPNLITAIILKVLNDSLAYLPPYLVKLLIKEIKAREAISGLTCVYTALIVALSLVLGILNQNTSDYIARTKAATGQILRSIYYKKLKKSSYRFLEEASSSFLSNMVNVELDRIANFVGIIPSVFSVPISLTISAYFLYQQIEYIAWAPYMLFAVLLTLNLVLKLINMRSKFLYNEKNSKRADLLDQIIPNMKLAKLNSMEEVLLKALIRLRAEELTALGNVHFFDSLVEFVQVLYPLACTAVSIVLYYQVEGKFLESEDTYNIVSIFSVSRASFVQISTMMQTFAYFTLAKRSLLLFLERVGEKDDCFVEEAAELFASILNKKLNKGGGGGAAGGLGGLFGGLNLGGLGNEAKNGESAKNGVLGNLGISEANNESAGGKQGGKEAQKATGGVQMFGKKVESTENPFLKKALKPANPAQKDNKSSQKALVPSLGAGIFSLNLPKTSQTPKDAQNGQTAQNPQNQPFPFKFSPRDLKKMNGEVQAILFLKLTNCDFYSDKITPKAVIDQIMTKKFHEKKEMSISAALFNKAENKLKSFKKGDSSGMGGRGSLGGGEGAEKVGFLENSPKNGVNSVLPKNGKLGRNLAENGVRGSKESSQRSISSSTDPTHPQSAQKSQNSQNQPKPQNPPNFGLGNLFAPQPATSTAEDSSELFPGFPNLTKNLTLKKVLSNINLLVNAGDSLCLIGARGSGRRSLLYSILRETILVKGEMVVQGELGLLDSQNPCIVPGTVRDNIVLSEPFNKQKYDYSVKRVHLDFGSFFGGDGMEIVGDTGDNLTLLERKKILLARAIYCDVEILLMTDFFDSISGSYESKILFEAILKEFSNKIVILVSNNLRIIKKCSKVSVVEDGQITCFGRFGELIKDKESSLYQYVAIGRVRDLDAGEEVDPSMKVSVGTACLEKKINRNNFRDRHVANVKAKVFPTPESSKKASESPKSKYLKKASRRFRKSINLGRGGRGGGGTPAYSIGGKSIDEINEEINKKIVEQISQKNKNRVIGGLSRAASDIFLTSIPLNLILTLVAINVGVSFIFLDLWVGLWSADLLTKSNEFYFEWYAIGSIWTALSYILGQLFFKFLARRGLRVIFRQIVVGLMNQPLNFYVKTPVSRVIYRLTKDIAILDENFVLTFEKGCISILLVLGGMGILTYVTFGIFALFVLVAVVFMVSVFRKNTRFNRSLFLLSNRFKARMMSLLEDTLDCSVCLRSLRQPDYLDEPFFAASDFFQNTASHLGNASKRWLGVRMTFLSFAGYVVVYGYVLIALIFNYEGMVGRAWIISFCLNWINKLRVYYSNFGNLLVDVETQSLSFYRIKAFIPDGEEGSLVPASEESESKGERGEKGGRESLEGEGVVSSGLEKSGEKKKKKIDSWESGEDSGTSRRQPGVGDPSQSPLKSKKRIIISPEYDQKNAPKIAIRLKNFKFAYNDGMPRLDGLNLEIKTAQKVCVIGRNGSGRHTLMNAVLKIYARNASQIDPSETFEIFGQSVEELDPISLRKHIMYISKAPILFHGTVRTNIDPNNRFSEEEIIKAMSYLHIPLFLSMGKIDGRGRESGGGDEGRAVSSEEGEMLDLGLSSLKRLKSLNEDKFDFRSVVDKSTILDSVNDLSNEDRSRLGVILGLGDEIIEKMGGTGEDPKNDEKDGPEGAELWDGAKDSQWDLQGSMEAEEEALKAKKSKMLEEEAKKRESLISVIRMVQKLLLSIHQGAPSPRKPLELLNSPEIDEFEKHYQSHSCPSSDRVMLRSFLKKIYKEVTDGSQIKLILLIRLFLEKPPLVFLEEESLKFEFLDDDDLYHLLWKRLKHSTVIGLVTHFNNLFKYENLFFLEKGVISESGVPLGLLRQPESRLSLFMREYDPGLWVALGGVSEYLEGLEGLGEQERVAEMRRIAQVVEGGV